MKKKYFTEEEKKQAENTYQKRYRMNHREKRNTYQKQYYQTHKKETKEYFQEYYQNHKEKILEYHKNRKHITNKQLHLRLKNNLNFKLAHYLRSRLRKAIIRGQKSGSAVRDLGCTIPEFKTYLESKWKEGMTWKNYGYWGWHIDHIIPLDFFNLQDREELLKACHYTNLQPMWAEENLKKHNKIVRFVV